MPKKGRRITWRDVYGYIHPHISPELRRVVEDTSQSLDLEWAVTHPVEWFHIVNRNAAAAGQNQIDDLTRLWHVVSYTSTQGINAITNAGNSLVGNKSKQHPNQSSLNTKKKKFRKALPPSTQDPLSNQLPEPTQEPLPTQDPDKPQMSAYSSFPNTHSCVDLGVMHPRRKGGPRGDRIPFQEGERTETTYGQIWGKTYANDTSDTRKYFFPFDVGHTANTVVGASQFSQPNYDSTETQFGHFNGAQQLLACTDTSDANSGTFVYPRYADPVGATDGHILNPGSSDKRYTVIKDQTLSLSFKNLSVAVESTNIDTESNIHVTVWLIQAKDHIMQLRGDQTVANFLSQQLSVGFKSKFADASTDIQATNSLANSDEQPLYVNIRDNAWFTKTWDIVETKKFCLGPGQEGQMRVSLKQPQVLGYKWLQQGNLGVNNYWNVPLIKKGQQTFLFAVEGGHTSMQLTAAPGVEETAKPVKAPCVLSLHGWFRYSYQPMTLGADFHRFLSTNKGLQDTTGYDDGLDIDVNYIN